MQVTLAGRSIIIVLLDSWGKYTRVGDATRIRQWLEVASGRSNAHQTSAGLPLQGDFASIHARNDRPGQSPAPGMNPEPSPQTPAPGGVRLYTFLPRRGGHLADVLA